MMETIAIYYTPLASTKVASAIGLGLAYHLAIVYTNAAGVSFGCSSGPSNHMTAQSPRNAITAIVSVASNAPSDFGVLLSDPANDHPFRKGRPEDYYTQDDIGMPYPWTMVMEGRDLSAKWHTIVDTYAAVGRLRLTYAPVVQNSNSMAGTALRSAGIAIPFSSATWFAPAMFTRLPTEQRDMGSMP